ncbi:MAG: FAD binding domain-containing protein [Melioribacteraceae bacterium]|nr:FAD binding domain-containing protein [Melioribacteraceae bacterium]
MLNNFEFIKAKNLEEVLQLLSNSSIKTKIISGGTDVIPGMMQSSSRFSNVKRLIDINAVSELESVKETNNNVLIGSGLTFTDIVGNELLNQEFPLLCKASSKVGSLQIRNRATIGGNIVNNAPCADSLSPLLCYDASLIIQSKHLRKQIMLKDFLQKPYSTLLGDDEIITFIQIPKLRKNYKGDFYKLGRRRGVAISRLSLSVLIYTENNIIKDLRIAGGAIAPVAIRFDEVENFSTSKKINKDLLITLSQKVGKTVLDITGLRWSSDYKLPVVQQSLYQLLRKILYN